MASPATAAKGAKRSLRTISAHGKLEAIRRVHDGESKASVARDIGVPESTLRGWCKNESKISYLSRQSSPDTDEAPEPKRPRSEEPLQPFNLSLRPPFGADAAPRSPPDFPAADAAPRTPLTTKTETPRAPERNRAELARLSVELGLNRPEMTTTATAASSNLAELAANFNLLSQWNLLVQQQLKKPDAPKARPPKEQQSTEEYIKCWLKTQEALGRGGASAPPPTTTASGVHASWFWNWYKQLTYGQSAAEKPILYQQLTKDAVDAENLSASSKVKSVLDSLLHNNNNTVERKTECLSYGEAVEHGEKFLRWLESCSNPSVTAMQIMQFRALLGNVKSGADRRNGDQSKTKVKRK